MSGMPQDLSAVAFPIRTERLTIRPSTEDDAAAMYAYRSIPEVAEWLPIAPTDPVAYAERFRDPDRMAVTLIAEVDGEVVGDLFLMLQDAWSQVEVAEQGRAAQAEIGWAIAPKHTGIGLATEGARELLRICFEDLGVRRVVAVCFATNVASWKIMEKLGMRREQETKGEALHRSGEWFDGVGYAILAEEWRAAQGR